MQEARSPRKALVVGLFKQSIYLAPTAAGVWSATVLVEGFRLDGSTTRQVLAIVLIAGLFPAVTSLFTIPAQLALASVLLADVSRQLEDDDFEPDNTAPKPTPHVALAAMLTALLFVSVIFFAAPAALWLCLWLCNAVGLPVNFPDGWGAYTSAAALIFTIGLETLGGVFRRPGKTYGWRGWTANRLDYLLTLGGLWLSMILLSGVRLETGNAHYPVLTIFVFAGILSFFQFPVPGRMGVFLQFAVNIVAVWLLAWLSGWLTNSLLIAGPTDLVLAALISTIVTMPVRLIRPPIDLSNVIKWTGTADPER